MAEEKNNDTELIKAKIDELDLKIMDSNQKKDLYEQLQYEFNSINKSFEKIVDLMSSAMQSDEARNYFDEIKSINSHNYKTSKLNLEGDIGDIQKLINNFSEERDKLKDKIKNEE